MNERKEEEREVLDAAMLAGHILLENGAEIFRVEETMDRICRHYGIKSCSSFVLSNGIFTTAGDEREEIFAKVQHIPVSGTHLDRVAAVNQLSREIEAGSLTPYAVRERLDQIQRMPGKSKKMQILASGVGSACFCYLFGGNVKMQQLRLFPEWFYMDISFFWQVLILKSWWLILEEGRWSLRCALLCTSFA